MKPLSELFKNIVIFPIRLIGGIHWKLVNGVGFIANLWRQALFISAPSNRLLLTNSRSETFIISSNDKVIGASLFAKNLFDYEKLELAVGLLGADFRCELLVDIGANIGPICIPAVNRKLFSQAIAIEPEPLNYKLLGLNVLLNDAQNEITTYNVALGNAVDGELEFELSPSNFGDHRVRVSDAKGKDGEDSRELIRVRMTTLDMLVGHLNAESSLMWMDTQGFEGFVLMGAFQALKDKVPLVMEFWPYGIQRSESYPQLKAALMESSYRYFYDLSDPSEKYNVSVESIDAIWKKLGETGEFTDLLFMG